MADGSPERRRRGFSYRVTDELIRRSKALPPEVKLRWLEDANRFLAVALTRETRAIQNRFRRGELWRLSHLRGKLGGKHFQLHGTPAAR